MEETWKKMCIPCSLVHSNLSLNSHRSVVDDALLGISRSLLQNPVEPNLSTKVA